jgi:hypothetical protein
VKKAPLDVSRGAFRCTATTRTPCTCYSGRPVRRGTAPGSSW